MGQLLSTRESTESVKTPFSYANEIIYLCYQLEGKDELTASKDVIALKLGAALVYYADTMGYSKDQREEFIASCYEHMFANTLIIFAQKLRDKHPIPQDGGGIRTSPEKI